MGHILLRILLNILNRPNLVQVLIAINMNTLLKLKKKYTQKEYDNPAVAMIAIIRFVGVLKICPSFIFINKFIWSSFSFFESMDL